MKPRIHLTDPSFRYVSSTKTDIRKTFARERRRLAEEAKTREAKVAPIKRARTA